MSPTNLHPGPANQPSAPSPNRHLVVVPANLAGSIERATAGHVDDEPLPERLQVGELARATGKTVRALHLYEDMGLLRPVGRSDGRYRLYTPDAVVRVRWISKLQSLGLSLSEIQDIAREHEASHSAQSASAGLGEVYRAKLADVRARIAQLRELEAELLASVRFLESCDTACVPAAGVESCPTCERHAEPRPAPELVAGARAAL